MKGHSDRNDLSRNDRSYSSCISQNQYGSLVKRVFTNSQRAPTPRSSETTAQQGLRRSRILAVLSCPGCSQKLRVPDGKRGTVSCPHCGSEWFHPETIELSDVEFRCSKSGARFNVISSRRSPLHKFVIQATNKAAPKATHPSQTVIPSSSPQLAVKARPALPEAGTKIGGWVVGILRGKAADLPASMTPGAEGKDQTSGADPAAASHDADEYNWSGFVCPYCSASSFVSCAGGHLACDGTIQIRKGGRFHQCFCGHAAFISGTMKTLESIRLSVEGDRSSDAPRRAQHMQQTGKAADVVLPPPPKGLPAKG